MVEIFSSGFSESTFWISSNALSYSFKVPGTRETVRTSSPHLLRPEAFQFLLQSRAQPQLQLLPLLARGLQLSQRALQPLHLGDVGPLPLQLVLQLAVAGLRRGQRLLEQLPPPLALLAGDAQLLNLPLQLFALPLLLFI